MKTVFAIINLLIVSSISFAQLSNSQIMKIKEDADDGKTLWIKLFEDSYTKKNMSELPALRQANESFLSENISKLSRMYAEGDGRELITAVKNYLVIERQFVKDVMIEAESLKPGDDQGYEALNRKMGDFAQKERSFDLDITNALRMSPEPMSAEPQEPEEPEQAELTEEEIKAKEEAKPRRKGKLPHEVYDEKGKKKKGNDDDEDE